MRPKILDGYIYCSKKVVVENLLKYTNQLYNYSDGANFFPLKVAQWR